MMVEPGAVPGGVGFFLGLWVTMMAAMMLSAAAPTVLIVAACGARALGADLVCDGYLLLWSGYGLLAYGLVRLLPSFSHQIERMIVDFELVCDELGSRSFVSGDDAGHPSVGLERP